jgi:hypothetical protein
MTEQLDNWLQNASEEARPTLRPCRIRGYPEYEKVMPDFKLEEVTPEQPSECHRSSRASARLNSRASRIAVRFSRVCVRRSRSAGLGARHHDLLVLPPI